MDFDLRKAILANIKGKTEEQLRDMIETSIEDHDEKTLPGLGVIFEVMWLNLDYEIQDNLVKTLHKNI